MRFNVARGAGSQSFDVEMNKVAKQLFSGNFLNGRTLGYIAGKCLGKTIGAGSITHEHFNKGQGTWAPLAPSTLKNPRKKDKRKFVYSGKAKDGFLTPPVNGKVMQWGSSADIHASGFGRKRYVANGMWSIAVTKKTSLELVTGFSGKFKHTAAFNKARQELAIKKGANLKGKTGRARQKTVRHFASVRETEKYIAEIGRGKLARNQKKRIKKYAAMGAKGIDGGKIVKARGKHNLAYANIVQTGKFKGIETKSKLGRKKFISATQMGDMVRAGKKDKLPGKGEYKKVYGGKARPILPYKNADAGVISETIAMALQDIFRLMGG